LIAFWASLVTLGSVKIEPVVIARYANGGIGDHLSCFIASWWLAKRTQRTLVVDWRGSRFNSDTTKTKNCFLDYFSIGQELDGVKVIANDSVSELNFEGPFFPIKWTNSNLAACSHVPHTPAEIEAVNCLVTSARIPEERTIAINQWVHPMPTGANVKAMLKELRFKEDTVLKASKFWDEAIANNPCIAIHIRHGNGENIGRRAAYWLSPSSLIKQLLLNRKTNVHRQGVSGKFLDNMPESLIGLASERRAEKLFYLRIAEAVKKISNAFEFKGAKVLLLTDSECAIEGMREVIPSILTLPKALSTMGSGPLHALKSADVSVVDRNITDEMFIELELLRRSKAMVYMDSGFTLLQQLELAPHAQHRLKPTLANRLILKFIP
jgi:hypothetical protein